MDFFVSNRNKQGVILLIIFSIIIVFIPRITAKIWDTKVYEFNEEIRSLPSGKQFGFKRKKFYSASNNWQSQKFDKFKIPERKFDPNTYTKQQWMALGLSDKQSAVVLKFTNRGVYKLEDIERIFVIPEALFLKIKDSLYFPSKPNLAFERKSLLKVNINNATIEELEKLPGIGQYTAEKIVNFRDKLGGFHSKEQLLEVYNFKLETYDQVTPLIIVDDQYKKLNINAATFDELNNHPYISKNAANSIVKLRNQKGTFTKLEELLDSKIISEELFFKIKPYLTL